MYFFLLFFKFGNILKKLPLEVFNKKMFLKILQNWHEKTCIGANLKLLKKESLAQVHLQAHVPVILQIFLEHTFFIEHSNSEILFAII